MKKMEGWLPSLRAPLGHPPFRPAKQGTERPAVLVVDAVAGPAKPGTTATYEVLVVL